MKKEKKGKSWRLGYQQGIKEEALNCDKHYKEAYKEGFTAGENQQEKLTKILVEEVRQETIKEVENWAKLLKEQELPRACEDYSGDLDEKICFDDGYSEAIADLKQSLEKCLIKNYEERLWITKQ